MNRSLVKGEGSLARQAKAEGFQVNYVTTLLLNPSQIQNWSLHLQLNLTARGPSPCKGEV